MVPVRPKSEIFKAVTLWVLTSQVMPIQLQTEVFEVQFLAVIRAFRARRACWSVVLMLFAAAITKERSR